MNSAIYNDLSIHLENLTFSQVKSIQKAIRRTVSIEKKINPRETDQDEKMLCIIDDICNKYSQLILNKQS